MTVDESRVADEGALADQWQAKSRAVALDVTRVAGQLCGAEAEVCLFTADRGLGMVVGGPHRRIMQNRPLVPSELALQDQGRGHVAGEVHTSFGISDSAGTLRGSLTVGPDAVVADPDAIHGLCRLFTSVVEQVSQEGRADALLRGLPDAMLVLEPDFTVSWASAAAASVMGRSPLGLVGMSAADLVHPDDLELALDSVGRLQTGSEVWAHPLRLIDDQGNAVPVDVAGTDMTMDPEIGAMVLAVRRTDNVDIKGAQADRLRTIAAESLTQTHEGVITADSSGALLMVNAAARSILGVNPDKTAGEIAIDEMVFIGIDGAPVSPEDHPVRMARSSAITDQHYASATDNQRKLLVTGGPINDDDGETIGSVLTIRDITEAERARAELRKNAFHDQLTGLANRRKLLDWMPS